MRKPAREGAPAPSSQTRQNHCRSWTRLHGATVSRATAWTSARVHPEIRAFAAPSRGPSPPCTHNRAASVHTWRLRRAPRLSRRCERQSKSGNTSKKTRPIGPHEGASPAPTLGGTSSPRHVHEASRTGAMLVHFFAAAGRAHDAMRRTHECPGFSQTCWESRQHLLLMVP